MKPRPWVRTVWRAICSQRLTTALLLLLFLLTYVGTHEQVERGLFAVQQEYFESAFVVHDVRLTHELVLPVPLPGVTLLLALLAVNLVCGGLIRLKKHRGTLGVFVVHAGVLLLLASGLVDRQLGTEGHVTLFEGQRASDAVSYHEWEVVIFDATANADVTELRIPGTQFTDLQGDDSARFTSSELPFDLVLSGFVPNCRPHPASGTSWVGREATRTISSRGKSGGRSPPQTKLGTGDAIDGFVVGALPADAEDERNQAGIVAAIEPHAASDSGERAILWGLESPFLRAFPHAGPWTVRAGGQVWAIDLRRRRHALPFSVRLDDFHRELYPGTSIPRVFRSDVTQIQGDHEQAVRIEMNEPLRDGSCVIYQASWGPADARPGEPLFSTFSVVSNPADAWPLYSCVVISLGLLLVFGRKLFRHVSAQESA